MAKRSSLVAVLLYALIATSLFAGTAAASGTSGTGEQVADELIVRFDGSLTDREEDDEVVAAGARPDREVDRDLRIKLVKVRPGEVASTAAKLQGRRGVAYAEPNYIVHAIAPARRPGALLANNDPRFDELWGLHNTGQVVGGVAGTPGADISAATAWDTTTGSTGSSSVVVGIVDTGIAYAHPDLAANIWSNPGVAGCPAGTHGFNSSNIFGFTTCDPNDDNDHGSHVAGTIGAVGGNNVGVVGVNWNVKLMGLKFLNAAGSGTTAGAISAINFAVQAKNAGVNVRALNNSWGGGGFSQALLDKINQANDAGILFVAAAGNDGRNNDTTANYPSSYNASNIVAVAATTNTDARASFSNYGATSVDLGAPGVGILSTIRGGAYASFSGTSMATPHVTGVAALVLAVPAFADLSVGDLKTRLLQSVDLIDSLRGITVTGGRINAAKAVGPATPPPPDFSLSVTPASQPVTQGGTATYTVTITPSGGFAELVSLAVSGLPAGATGTFSPIPDTTSSTLTVTTSADTPTGSSTLTVNGTSTGTAGTLTHTANATLVVNPPGDFSLSLSPTSVTIRQGRNANYTVTITRTAGFSGSVAFSAFGLPAGWTATFTPSSTTGTTAQLAVKTTRTTAPGTYTFTVSGTSGELVHTVAGTVVLTGK